jgi:DNA-binding CsgD family transcriptional regulator
MSLREIAVALGMSHMTARRYLARDAEGAEL